MPFTPKHWKANGQLEIKPWVDSKLCDPILVLKQEFHTLPVNLVTFKENIESWAILDTILDNVEIILPLG